MNIPREVIKVLKIDEGDDIDFIQYKGSYYIIAKRSDIAKLITNDTAKSPDIQQSPKSSPQFSQTYKVPKLSDQELLVLKKLDTLRYSQRTTEQVSKLLVKEERTVFKQLEKKGVITPFKDAEQIKHYSIGKIFYDNYLMRNKPSTTNTAVKAAPIPEAPTHIQGVKTIDIPKQSPMPSGDTEKYIDALQNNGYLVVQTEPEAASISAALEDSIRRGLVLGTRAFNKKFYIVMRSFINSKTKQIMEQISEKSVSVPTIAKACKIDEDGVRAVLYILAESGEVTEARKDIFRLA